MDTNKMDMTNHRKKPKARSVGRPKKADGTHRVHFSVRLTPELRARLDARAERENTSITALTQRALDKYLRAKI